MRNKALTKAREQAGYNQRQLAEKSKVHYENICNYEGGKYNPSFDNALKIAIVLNKPIDEIFPEIFEQRKRADVENLGFRKNIPADDSPQRDFETNELIDKLNQTLARLTPRQRTVIELRYGLSGYNPQTLEEIGKTLKVTTERVRQIESGAMIKLQDYSHRLAEMLI